MELNDQERAWLDALAKNEAGIGALYQILARQFEPAAAFWTNLANAEFGHCAMIKKLGIHVAEGAAALDLVHHPKKAIDLFADYIAQQTQRVTAMPLLNSLRVALDIEGGLIEKDFFAAFTSYAPASAQILNQLRRELKEHNDALRAACTEAQQGRFGFLDQPAA